MRLKHSLIFLAPIIFLTACVVAPNTPAYYQPVYYGPGIGLGTIIAVVISWQRNKSILLAILCGILGWIYVIYALLVPRNKGPPLKNQPQSKVNCPIFSPLAGQTQKRSCLFRPRPE